MGTDKNETKRVKTSDLNKQAKKKTKKTKKDGKLKFKDKHPKLAKGIKIGILVFILLLIIGAGILVGAFVGIFGDELKIDEASLVVGYENSTVYDADGNQIAILSGGTKRKSIGLSDMSEYLPKAYVAIEDERFYEHSGIDIGRTAYATVTYIFGGGSSSFGGSTITQQVIKNITKEKDNTALAGAIRKVKEISKAIQVEHYLSKDQILELYLNLIFVGGDDVNGVELGSVYYFDKSAKDLSIAECAYLAGINHSPNAYKPFEDYDGDTDKKTKMQEKIKTRTKTVLGKMKELAYISDEQYNQAVSDVDAGLNFKKGESASVTTDVSYITEAAIDQILDQILAENEDMSRDMAEMTLYSSGYKIYTTQKSDIQKVLEEEIVKEKYITKTTYTETNKETGEKEKITQYSIPTMVIEDHKTGHIVAAATATGNSEERTAITKLGYLNYPTEIKKQTGSSMKPIAVIAPGLESGTITGATTYYNRPTTWGTGANAWNPKNYNGYTQDIMNMRRAIEESANIPHAKALTNIGTEVAVEFCKQIGLPDFTAEGINLALGGLHDGVSPAQMAAAYSAIANDGVYKTPTYYTKVEDATGKVVFEPKQEEVRVMSEQNAYIEKDILTQPVIGANGTATYCAIKGMDVAAKTGTTNDDFDRWLCGFTPYYTATCWYGYPKNAGVSYSGNPAGKIWDAVMTTIHEDLENAEFEKPEGIIEKTVCRISGKTPAATCTEVYTELFTEASVPTTACEGHGSVSICNDSQMIANPTCPNVTNMVGYIPEYEREPVWTTQGAITTTPTGNCTLHQSVGGYVTPEDQARFQAATEADAMGLTGQAREDYINNAGNAAKQQQQQTTSPATNSGSNNKPTNNGGSSSSSSSNNGSSSSSSSGSSGNNGNGSNSGSGTSSGTGGSSSSSSGTTSGTGGTSTDSSGSSNGTGGSSSSGSGTSGESGGASTDSSTSSGGTGGSSSSGSGTSSGDASGEAEGSN